MVDTVQLIQMRETMVILMLTDVLLEDIQLLYIGSDESISQAFNVMPKENVVFLLYVMS